MSTATTKLPVSAQPLQTDILSVFYAALFQPSTLYQSVVYLWPVSHWHLWYAVIVVITVFTSLALLTCTATGLTVWAMLGVITMVGTGVLWWLFNGLVYAGMAYCFRTKSQLPPVLAVTGYALAPLVLVLPLSLLANAIGLAGVTILAQCLLGLGLIVLCLWSCGLHVMGVKQVYHLTAERTLLVFLLPAFLTATTICLVILFVGLGLGLLFR